MCTKLTATDLFVANCLCPSQVSQTTKALEKVKTVGAIIRTGFAANQPREFRSLVTGRHDSQDIEYRNGGEKVAE